MMLCKRYVQSPFISSEFETSHWPQEDVWRLCQPSGCSWHSPWCLGEIPLHRASLCGVHWQEVIGQHPFRGRLRSAVSKMDFKMFSFGFFSLNCKKSVESFFISFFITLTAVRQPYDQLLLEIINQGKDDLEKVPWHHGWLVMVEQLKICTNRTFDETYQPR